MFGLPVFYFHFHWKHKMGIKMRLVEFLKIFSQTNQKMKTIFFSFSVENTKKWKCGFFPYSSLYFFSFLHRQPTLRLSISCLCVSSLSHKPFPHTSLHRSCSATLPPQHHFWLTISWWDFFHVSFFLLFLLHKSMGLLCSIDFFNGDDDSSF